MGIVCQLNLSGLSGFIKKVLGSLEGLLRLHLVFIIFFGSSVILAENLSGFANPTGLYEANRQNHG